MPSHRPDVGTDRETIRRLSGLGTVLWVGAKDSREGVWLEEWLVSLASTESTDEALAWLEDTAFLFAVVEVCDEGLRFLREVYEAHPGLGVIALVARDAVTLTELLNLDASSAVLTPVDESFLMTKVYRELSAVHDRERQLKYLNRLETEVRLRTRELHDSQIEVVRLQEAKDNMLALVSHEIRTPLNGILGFIDLLRSPEFASDAPAFLAHVEESARRLERSTRKALDFASLSTGLRSPRFQRHRVRSLLEAAQEQAGTPAGLVVWEGSETLDTDGELTVQVFRNLLENSAKYGRNSSVSVTLIREGFWNVLSFRDHGPGFSNEVLPTLFQPFSTGDIMHHAEGMGLGLALVDVIMLTLGGRSEACNAADGGAVVTLRFPIREL